LKDELSAEDPRVASVADLLARRMALDWTGLEDAPAVVQKLLLADAKAIVEHLFPEEQES
jgi:hypothetical protein